VGFAGEGFFEDLLPGFYVGADIIEGFAVYLDVLGWVWGAV